MEPTIGAEGTYEILSQEEEKKKKKKKSAYVATLRTRVVLVRRHRGHTKPGDGHAKKGEGIMHENYLTEEEKQKKLVYVVLSPASAYRDPDYKLLRIDPHAKPEPGDGVLEDISPLLAKDPPSDFNLIYRFSVAALHSKIYFIGGCYKKGGYRPQLFSPVVSRKVFAFDTGSNQWDASPTHLKHGRLYSTVLTYNNKIYVFGYKPFGVLQPGESQNPELQQQFGENENPSDELKVTLGPVDPRKYPEGLSLPKWVEVFDHDTLKWDFVPSNGKIPTPLVRRGTSVTPAVHGDSAFFCLQAHTLYRYHFPTRVWTTLSTYPDDTLDGPALYWSNAVVVFRSFLLFHHYGTIYAMKAGNGLEPSDLLTLWDVQRACGTPSFDMFDPRPPSPSFLVNAGNGVMCLVRQFSHALEFHKIGLQVSSSDEIPSLHDTNYSELYSHNGSFYIPTVLAM